MISFYILEIFSFILVVEVLFVHVIRNNLLTFLNKELSLHHKGEFDMIWQYNCDNRIIFEVNSKCL